MDAVILPGADPSVRTELRLRTGCALEMPWANPVSPGPITPKMSASRWTRSRCKGRRPSSGGRWAATNFPTGYVPRRAASVRANIARTNERIEALKADHVIINQSRFCSGAGGAVA